MKTVALAALMVVAFAHVTLAQQVAPPALPPGFKGGGEMAEGEVLKVYSLEDQGAKYRAYVVKYKNGEVVVGDTMATSTNKIGDKIKFIVARVEAPIGGSTVKTMSFSIVPAAPSKAPKPAKK
jgi:hypothetical protein